MTLDQTAILLVLGLTVLAFALDRWRYDVIALVSLLTCVSLGLVEKDTAFQGFTNPAVVTVVSVLLCTYTIARSGIIERAGRLFAARSGGTFGLVAPLCLLGAALSAFMNNIGALALLLPVAVAAAERRGIAAGVVLMPLSFATLLGGMTTLIGTPPNLLVSAARRDAVGESFGFFAFLPAGAAVAVAGLGYLILIGWRLMRSASATAEGESSFEVEQYAFEVRVESKSDLCGRRVEEAEAALGLRVHALLRENMHVFARKREKIFRPGDIAVMECDLTRLTALARKHRLTLLPGKSYPDAGEAGEELIEGVVMPSSAILGSNLKTIQPRARWGIDIVALALQHRRLDGRLDDAAITAGDVVLVRGRRAAAMDALADMGCLPLAERRLAVDVRRAAPALGCFVLAIALASSGVIPPEFAFFLAATGMMVFGALDIRSLPRRIDWSVVVMLGAIIPVGGALETTGTADLLARSVLEFAPPSTPILLLALTLVVTTLFTSVLNNAATVIVIAPIAISVAKQAALSPDPFLIAIAIAASSSFLTPIGHHNNMLIMGPGGYRFWDYGRLGLGLTLVVWLTSLLAIPLIWPF